MERAVKKRPCKYLWLSGFRRRWIALSAEAYSLPSDLGIMYKSPYLSLSLYYKEGLEDEKSTYSLSFE